MALLMAMLGAHPLVAALGVNAVWEINASGTASNVNAGYFNPGNANFIANFTTDSNTANTASPVVSSATYNFVAGDVGAWIYVKSGTSWVANRYCAIASVASNKATISAAIGACVDVASPNGFPTPKYAASTTVGIATVGTPTSGTIGIDYSRSTAAIDTATDLASLTGTTNPCTVTSASLPFGINHAGNGLHINSGTNWTADWYEIVSVSTVTATLDKACASAATVIAGTYHLGGALSLNSTLDDDLFEKGLATNGSGANRFFVKNGAYTIGETINTAANGGTQAPIIIEGYNTLRGDTPTGANRPVWDTTSGAIAVIFGTNWDIYNLSVKGSGSTSITAIGAAGKAFNCKFVQSRVTTAGNAVVIADKGAIFNSEAISYRGSAVNLSGSAVVYGNYLHDSAIGITATGGTAYVTVSRNIIEGNATGCFVGTNNVVGDLYFENNTFYGGINKTGNCFSIATGVNSLKAINNIITGFTTGLTVADVQTNGWSDYNDYYNNTNDVADATKMFKGTNDIAINPSFGGVSQFTGSGGTSATTTLTYGTGGFNTSGLVDNQDFVNITSATTATVGQYLITSHTDTTLVLTPSPGTGSNIVFQINIGHNFAVGSAIGSSGFPGGFQAGLTSGFLTIGAVQRSGSGGVSVIPIGQ